MTTITTTPLQWSDCDQRISKAPQCLRAVAVLGNNSLAYTAAFVSTELLYPGDILKNPSVTNKRSLIIDEVLHRESHTRDSYQHFFTIAKATIANIQQHSFAPLPQRLEEHQRAAALRASNWAQNIARIQKANKMPFLKAGIIVQRPKTARRGRVLGGLEGLYIAVEFDNRPHITERVRADLDLIYLNDQGILLASYERPVKP